MNVLESPPPTLAAERKVLSAFAHGDFALGHQRDRIRSQNSAVRISHQSISK
jgi:hypothetical protein